MPQHIGDDIRHIGQYEVKSKIAEGGFGAVYLAFDPRLERDVAIKVLHAYHADEPDRAARFVREARSAARLNHAGIVQIFDVVEEKGRMALVMELVEGANLDRYLREHPDLTLQHKLFMAATIAETLHVAHQAGIIHRDVKPGNVMVDKHGHVKLTDFSLARLVDTSLTPLTGENNVLGTPAYMSPEQCQGYDAVPQSDLYSLGVILYEMASGSLPFEAENYLALLRHHTDTPPTPVRMLKPTLPLDLERIIMQCLAKHVDQRPASGLVLAEALRALAISPAVAQAAQESANQTVALPARQTPDSQDGPILPTPSPTALHRPTPTPMPMPTPTLMPMPTPTPMPMSVPTPTPDQLELPKPVRRWGSRTRILAGALVVIAVAALGYFLLPGGGTDDTGPVAETGFLGGSALQSFISKPDDNYGYRQAALIEDEGYKAYVLDMASQTWHADKVSPPVWKHWLTIIVPEKVTADKALLVFSEGLSRADKPMDQVPFMLLATALSTKSVVAVMEGFPRDPIGFHGEEPSETREDRDRFAVETFQRYLETEAPSWPIAFPLAKAAVRAMDTVQAFAAENLKLEKGINSFVLTGEANGWGQWLSAAVDDRVAGLAPIEFDLLNIGVQVEHQVGFRGTLSPFLSLLSESDVLPALDTAEGEKLLGLIDPYAYRNQLDMPKLLLLPSSNNAYSTIDAAPLYLDGLKGETYLYCAPNLAFSRGNPFLAQQGSLVAADGAGDLAYSPQDFRSTLQVFYHKILAGKPMPRLTWQIGQDGSYMVLTEDPPVEARLWLARSAARDFSYAQAEAELFDETFTPKLWRMERLTYSADGIYEGQVLLENSAYTAFYIELVYPSKLGLNYSLTTPTTVLEAQQRPSQVRESTPEGDAPKTRRLFM